MRSASIAVLREIGVETGGSNVQFAVNPKDGRMIVIEMNPRVSRSSALASKATGFPIAKVAAKLAVGYTLDEIANDITGGATPASFEPTIDYVVTKIPRFAFEKFKGAEATAVDRDEVGRRGDGDRPQLRRKPAEGAARAGDRACAGSTACASWRMPARRRSRMRWRAPTPDRLLVAAEALRQGFTVERIHEIAGFDPWFLERLAEIVAAEEQVRDEGLPHDAAGMRRLKAMGFSDARLAAAGAALGPCRARRCREAAARGSGIVHDALRGADRRRDRGGGAQGAAQARRPPGVQADRQLRRRVRCGDALSLLDLRGAAVRRARGRGASSATGARSSSSAAGPTASARGSSSIIAAATPAFALKEAGFETIMVNCNPETVSTDPDTSRPALFRAADRRGRARNPPPRGGEGRAGRA